MDINSLVANYLSNNSNADASDVASRLYNIAHSNGSNMVNYNSIFNYGNTADETELLNYFSDACGQDADKLADDVSLLFDILDQDGSGSLSDDELEIFQREQGERKGKIDGFGFYNDLINVNEANINEYLNDAESNKSTSTSNTTTKTKTSNTTSTSKTSQTKSTGLSDDNRIKTDSSGNNYVLVQTWKSNDSSLNSCLYYIIKHSYNFDELGVSYSSAKDKLLSAIVKKNNISNPNLVYTNQKIILPDAYEVLGINNS